MSETNKGFSLVEALIAVTITGFVIVSILSGFTQYKVVVHKNFSKNIGITLAEGKVEEYLKFTAYELKNKMDSGDIVSPQVEYIVVAKNRVEIFDTDPTDQKAEVRRTTTFSEDGNFIVINVEVEYGREENTFPFQVSLNTRRGGIQ
jgi:type II secretory pathway pseudopilin PulG